MSTFSLPVYASRGTYVSKNSLISQFADDTTLLCSDLSLVEKELQIVVDFGEISGLMLNLREN